MHYLIKSLGIVERILRDRLAYFDEIRRGEALPVKIAQLLTVTVLDLAIFGLVAGLNGEGTTPTLAQALRAMGLLPLAFLAGGLICLPTLYYFGMLFGARLRFLQTVTLILTAQTVSAVLALGCAPISLLFWLSGAGASFLAWLNVTALGLSAGLGLIFLVQGALYVHETAPPERLSFPQSLALLIKGAGRSLVLLGWLGVYGAVVLQLGRTLCPFVVAPLGASTFWTHLGDLLLSLPGRGW
jgi:hypothetical protein